MLSLNFIVSPYKTSWQIYSLLSTKHCQLLCANIFFFSHAFYFHQDSTHASFTHNTFYIQDVLCSSFLIVFSKNKQTKKSNKKSKNWTIFSSWPGYSDCVVYCTFWETILYILALDSLNWRTWEIPLEHNEYVKIYIHKVIFCKMYHSNKLLLVKTNMSGFFVSSQWKNWTNMTNVKDGFH